jgi:hypothetical protein
MNIANLSLRRRVCAACAFGLAITMNPARVHAIGAMLYATQFQANGNFYSVNTSTGAATAIGSTNSFVPAMDFRPSNGVLYGASSSLDTVNIKTGHATTIAPLSDLMVSIAFSPSDQLYAVNNAGDTLFTLNPVTGATLTRVPLTGTVFSSGRSFPGEINGIDFGPDGSLYGVGNGLYTINPMTGVASRITPLGKYITVAGDLFDDIDFGTDGVLRGLTSGASSISLLYNTDPSTGVGTLVGSTGFQMDGLASIPTPEPSAWALLLFGTVGLLVFRSRRHIRVPCRSEND